MFTTFYDNMKAKVQKGYNTQEDYFNLFSAVISMFDWHGLPDTIRPEVILLKRGELNVYNLLRQYEGKGTEGL